ncbi:MAG: hypothetical protein QOK40_1538, partial [Miltoncostaeaceae bacterium]|nr:hypothetical protein [Miltoncostaeaceae bacterium]
MTGAWIRARALLGSSGETALSWAVLLLAAVVWVGGLRLGWYTSDRITDIPTYRNAETLINAGQVPYRDFPLEYPPLAAALFWLAGALPGQYEVGFSALMLICLGATALGVMATARAAGLDERRQALAGCAVALSPLLLGDMVQTRFDLMLAALLSWTLYAAVAGRWRLAWTLLGLATLTKLVPLALAPILLIYQRHHAGTRRALLGLALGVAVVGAVLLPFVIMSPSGVWRIAAYHLDRPLQIESTGAAYLLGLHALADVPLSVSYSFGSQGLAGRGPDAISMISSALLLAALVAIAVTLALLLRRVRRGPGDARLFLAAAAATMAALLAGGKVLSPQFVIWLLPVGFVVAGRYGGWTFL